MKEPKNRNSARSIRMLEEAFLQLLAEMPYESITVSEVTRKAGLNRGTFYAHFTDIDDLMFTVMRELSAHLDKILATVLNCQFIANPEPVLRKVGSFVNTNHALLERLLSTRTLDPFYQGLREHLRQQVTVRLTHDFPHKTELALLVSGYISSGVINAFRLQSSTCEHMSEDEFYAALTELVTANLNLLRS